RNVQHTIGALEQNFVVEELQLLVAALQSLRTVAHKIRRHFAVNVEHTNATIRFPVAELAAGRERLCYCQREPRFPDPAKRKDETKIAFTKPITEKFLTRSQGKTGKLARCDDRFFERSAP